MRKTTQVASTTASKANAQFPQSTRAAADYSKNPLNQMGQAAAVPTTSAQSESTSATPQSSSPRKRRTPTSSSTPQKKKLQTGGFSTAPSNNVFTPSFALMRPLPKPPSLTRAKMVEYLRNKSNLNCTVSIGYPKIAKKSYGTEKRYFSPPPLIHLKGPGWDRKRAQAVVWYKNQERAKTANGMEIGPKQDLLSDEKAGRLWVYISGVPMRPREIRDRAEWQHEIRDFGGKDRCAVSRMSYSVNDKMDSFYLNTTLVYGSRLKVGQFRSQEIKKWCDRLPKKTADFRRIAFKMEVTLYCRRPGTDIQYLNCEKGDFRTDSERWDLFTIQLCDEKNESCIRRKFLHYGSVVIFKDSVSGKALQKLRIRKVHEQYAILDEDTKNEPVLEFDKVALQSVEKELNYLCCVEGDKVDQCKAKFENGRHKIPAEAVWTMTSAAKDEYTFYEAMGPVDGITPVPVVESKGIVIDGSVKDGSVKCVNIKGSHFNWNLTPWFGATPAERTFHRDGSLVCLLPSWTTVEKDYSDPEMIKSKKAPISLVRNDGVIYPTSLSVDYNSLKNKLSINFVYDFEYSATSRPLH